MTSRIHLDYETRSSVDIKEGVRRHAAEAEVILAAWAPSGGPVQQWDGLLQQGDLGPLLEAFENPEVEIHAFNAPFEREITEQVFGIYIPLERWHCTMAYAYSRGFTGRLIDVCRQIGVPEDQTKLKEGGRLINRFCVPPYVEPEDDLEAWERFKVYNIHDVTAERYIFTYLHQQHPETPEERATWLLDQHINARGLPIDMALVNNAIKMAEDLKGEALEQMKQITGLDNPNSRDQLLGWLREQGYPYGDLQKETIARVLGCKRK